MFYKTISFGVVKELFSEHFANFVVYKLSGKAELFVQYFGWGRISEVIYAVVLPLHPTNPSRVTDKPAVRPK